MSSTSGPTPASSGPPWAAERVPEPLRILIADGRSAFTPRARWVLGILAGAVGREAVFVDSGADLIYAPARPDGSDGVWIPLQPEAQAFFEQERAFPGDALHRAAGLDYLFTPTGGGAPFAGDAVASSFYLLARWDELHEPTRDRFDRLPLAASAFGNIDGLDLARPLVEDYIAALRGALGQDAPSSWSVAITHDIDRIRRRTAKGVAGMLRRRAIAPAARLALGDPWNNIPDLLEAAGRRGTAPTVYLIGRNRHRLDGTPRRTYERTRRHMARAVVAAGGEVGLHAAFASSESEHELRQELDVLRAEAGDVVGVRFHYLRFRYHETVRRLEGLGLEYDASLGFSEAPGFAAGIARPFRRLVGEIHREIRTFPLTKNTEPLKLIALHIDKTVGVLATEFSHLNDVECGLLVAAEFFLDFELDRQAVTIPTRTVGRSIAGQVLVL